MEPILWRSELRNVVATFVRLGRLPVARGLEAVQAAQRVLDEREYVVLSRDVLELAEESGCTAYDCELVALSRSLAAPLVTMDRALLEAFPETARSLDATLAPAEPR